MIRRLSFLCNVWANVMTRSASRTVLAGQPWDKAKTLKSDQPGECGRHEHEYVLCMRRPIQSGLILAS